METPVGVVRTLYDCFARGDVRGVLDCFGDDAEIQFLGPESIPFAGRYAGIQGMADALQRLTGACDVLEFGPDEFHAAGDFVTVLGHERCRSRTTGREWRTRLVDTYVVRDGKIRQFLCAYDTAAVADAYEKASFWTETSPVHY